MEDKKKNIWVVSSDEQLRELASTVLSKGYSVRGFKNPAEINDALGKIKDFNEVPAAIVADYTNEKKGDVAQVISAAQNFIVPIPVIVQSGDEGIGAQMLENDAAAFIKKPYDNGNKSLLNTIEMVVRSNEKKSVWIVNNNPALSNKMKDILGSQRYNFVVFDSDKDAVDVLSNIAVNNKKKPDLIIVDNNTLNGMSVVKKATEIGDIRTIIESSANVEAVAKSNGAGFILRSEIDNKLEDVVNDILKKSAPNPGKKLSMAR